MAQSTTIPITSQIEQESAKEIGLIKAINEDIRCALERDPAARNWLEVLVNYSGLHAIWAYRVTNWLWRMKLRFLPRWLSQLARWITGIEIHPGAEIGRRFFIDHGMGVVIGETSIIGNDVTLYHGVTLGGVSLERGKRHPTVGDFVVIGAGAKVLGNIKIGAGSRVGANAVVVRAVPPESVVVGIPGQVVKRSGNLLSEGPDLHHDRLPDTLGQTLQQVMKRLDRLEDDMQVDHTNGIKTDEKGFWIGSDFSI